MIDKIIGGRYRIIKELGQGGFGKTFLAEDTHLPNNPTCVVKQLRPIIKQGNQEIPVPKNSSYFQTAQRLFNTEAQALYKLGEHNQIPKLFAHFEDEEEFYLVQEFIEGDIFTKVINGQKWEENQVIDFLEDILTPLAFVHEHNVIHRDLKPDNLIVRKKDNKIVLIDFGAVKEIMSQTSSSGGRSQLTISIGTPGYMPSEQSNGNPRLSSDIYAVGMIAIQTLTGLLPTQLTTNPHTGEINWRNHLQVSPELAEVLDKMIKYDHRHRYQSAQEALQAINQLHNQRKLIINPKAIAILFTLLVAIFAGAFILTHTLDLLPSKKEVSPKKETPAF